MNKENITGQLMEIGLSENEARAYISLLESNPSTGYEIAKQSGIPSSKVYEVLRKLIQRGMVLELEEKGKTRYVPQESKDFVIGYRRKVESVLDGLEGALSSVGTGINPAYIWTFDSYEDCIEKVRTMIYAAEESLLLSVWEEDFPLIKDALKEKEEKCKIATIFFGDTEADLPDCGTIAFSHPIRNTIYNEKGGRGLVLVADGKQAFMGTFFPEGPNSIRAQGTFSKNDGFTAVAEDYVKHDMYIMKIVKRFKNELQKTFGEGYELLRDVYSDSTL